MKTVHQPLIITARSSLTHGGNRLGTILYLRRERFLTADGPEEIPVISGNALRGVLRDVGATMSWEALGEPHITVGATDVLWSGGSLTKARGEPVTGARLAEIRRFFPHIGLFGAAGGGRLIEGSLAVGKLLPMCAQTTEFIPAEHATPALDLWDLLQVEELSRFPDRSVPATLERSGEEPPADGTMRFGAESFIAGTRFSSWWMLTNATDQEHAFLVALLNRFAEAAHVGGRHAVGHGRITFDPPPLDHRLPAWDEKIRENPDRAIEVLEWLN